MKLDVKELERGFQDFQKEAFLGNAWNSAKNFFNNVNNVGKGMKYVTEGGLMNDLGDTAMSILPIVGLMGGMGGKAQGGKIPPININLGQSNPLALNPGKVTSFAGLGNKVGGLLDLGLLRTVLTARTANEMIDSVHGENDPAKAQTSAAAPVKENKAKVELTTRYPEIEKILADPQSRAYLESLLTNKTGYGT